MEGDGKATRQEYLDHEPIHENIMPLSYVSSSNSTYYYGEDTVTNKLHDESLEIRDDLEVLTGQHVTSELLGFGIGLAEAPVSIPLSIFMAAGGLAYEKAEMEDQLEWNDLKIPASKFNLEMQVNERASLERSTLSNAKLHPTADTYEILERWEDIHRLDPSFPYDGEAIQNQDWKTLYELFHEDSTEEPLDLEGFSEHNEQLYHYLLNGSNPDLMDNKVIEEIEANK